VLAGRRRLDDRHSSLRAALDWSYDLLDPAEQAVLRRVSVFAAPFTADDARRVVGFPPADAASVTAALALLADQSLLVVTPDRPGTRYRALETIRQYGAAALEEAAEQDEVADRHLRWAADQGRARRDELAGLSPVDLPAGWRLGFDRVADDLRAALRWAAARPDHRGPAHDLAVVLGELTFVRGLGGEAQRRFEEAAALADPAAAPTALRQAAGVALMRQLGEDSLRLYRAAARAALGLGDAALAAQACAEAAMLIDRCPGIFVEVPPDAEAAALMAEAERLAAGGAGDHALASTLLVAESFRGEERDPTVGLLADRAVDLARRVGDPLLESAALDGRTVVQLAVGDALGAAATARYRADLVLPCPMGPDMAFELPDALQMASETCVAIGDLPAARHYAERLRSLPFFGDDAHLSLSRLLIVEALAGGWERVLALSVPFKERWEEVGAPATSNLAMGAGAVAMVHGLRGDEAAADEWYDMVVALRMSLVRRYRTVARANPAFEAVVLLHRGRFDDALALLGDPPAAFRDWHSGRLRQWYAAEWAEAAVLAGDPSAADRLPVARYHSAGNPIATAIVDRAALLLGGAPPDDFAPLAAALDTAGCRYQAARTRVFAGGPLRAEGEAQLSALGATPMASP
jgi:hypothetical protein